jgi:hypothetical protein
MRIPAFAYPAAPDECMPVSLACRCCAAQPASILAVTTWTQPGAAANTAREPSAAQPAAARPGTLAGGSTAVVSPQPAGASSWTWSAGEARLDSGAQASVQPQSPAPSWAPPRSAAPAWQPQAQSQPQAQVAATSTTTWLTQALAAPGSAASASPLAGTLGGMRAQAPLNAHTWAPSASSSASGTVSITPMATMPHGTGAADPFAASLFVAAPSAAPLGSKAALAGLGTKPPAPAGGNLIDL